MLYASVSAMLAFTTPTPLMQQSLYGRSGPVSMLDSSWRRSYDGRGTGVKPLGGAAEASVMTASSTLTVDQACVFLAEESLAGMSTADKKAYLASKGVSPFVIAQAECVAPEDNVQGHPAAPVAA